MKNKPIHIRPKRWKKNRSSKTQQCINTTAHPDAAGIDIGADEIVAAVPPPDRATDSVRTFSSFTGGVHELRDWLLVCGVKTAAMESTGNYWVTTFDVLERAGIEVYLVNARHVKGVPGKKTDVCDAQWLQQLHSAGLLKKFFRPAQDILPLRYLMRHRAGLVEELARQVLLMQKVLPDMNLKIHHLFSDLDGVSAQAIITAILVGERDPATLAALRDRRCRSSVETVMAALRGDYREEYLFVLGQCQSQWRYHLQALAQLDERIEVLIEGIAPSPDEGDEQSGNTEQPAGRPGSKQDKPLGKNSLRMDVQAEAVRFYGVDLTTIDGVGSGLLGVLMSQLGTREQILGAFSSPARFCSWLGLNPANDISGGKVLKAKTRQVKNRLADAFRLCALGLANAGGMMGQIQSADQRTPGQGGGHHRDRAQTGTGGRTMIATGRAYDENEAFKITPQNYQKQLNKHSVSKSSLSRNPTPSYSGGFDISETPSLQGPGLFFPPRPQRSPPWQATPPPPPRPNGRTTMAGNPALPTATQRSPPWRTIPPSTPRPNGRHHGGQSRHHHRDPTVATMADNPAITTATQRSPPWRAIPPSPPRPMARDANELPVSVLPVAMNAHRFSPTDNQLLHARGRYPATQMLPHFVTRVSASCQKGTRPSWISPEAPPGNSVPEVALPPL